MATKQTTAVEWLFSQLPDHLRLSPNGFDMLSQASAMQQQQIEDAWISAWQDSMLEPLDRRFYEDLAQEYYNETYGRNKPNR